MEEKLELKQQKEERMIISKEKQIREEKEERILYEREREKLRYA